MWSVSRIVLSAAGLACVALVAPVAADDEGAPPAGAEQADPPRVPKPPELFAARATRKYPRGMRGKKDVEQAVTQALAWLAGQQRENGSWTDGPPAAEWSPGITSLALLAFLGHGENGIVGPYAENVRKAVAYLRSVQQEDGRIGAAAAPRPAYNHALGTLALSEAAGLSRDAATQESARRATAFCMTSRHDRYGAWGYGVREGSTNASVTASMLHALGVAQLCRVDDDSVSVYSQSLFNGVRGHYGRYGYDARPDGHSTSVHGGVAFRYRAHTAMALFARVITGDDLNKSRESVTESLAALDADALTDDSLDARLEKAQRDVESAQEWLDEKGGGGDPYGLYQDDVDEARADLAALRSVSMMRNAAGVPYLRDDGEWTDMWVALAAFQIGGDVWKHRWADITARVLPARQWVSGRDDSGSWQCLDPWLPHPHGRVYATAVRCLTLETPYRYAQRFKKFRPKK